MRAFTWVLGSQLSLDTGQLGFRRCRYLGASCAQFSQRGFMLVTQCSALGFARCERQAFQLGASSFVRSSQSFTLGDQSGALLGSSFTHFTSSNLGGRFGFRMALMGLEPGFVFLDRSTRVLTGTLGFTDYALLAGCILLGRSAGFACGFGFGIDRGSFRLTLLGSSLASGFRLWAVVDLNFGRLGEFAGTWLCNETSSHLAFSIGIWL